MQYIYRDLIAASNLWSGERKQDFFSSILLNKMMYYSTKLWLASTTYSLLKPAYTIYCVTRESSNLAYNSATRGLIVIKTALYLHNWRQNYISY